MAKVLDKVNDLVFVRLSINEYNKLNKEWMFDNDEDNFDSAVKSKEVKTKLSVLASKL